MTSSKLLPLALLTFAACSAGAIDDSDTAGDLGKADGFGAPRLVVVRNQIACVTAPCPVFTVIDPAGNVSRVADVELPDDPIGEFEAIGLNGLAVEGVIVLGDWSPNQSGDVLVVDRVVSRVGAGAPIFNGVVCFTAPCPSYTVIADDGNHSDVAGVDLSALDLPEQTEQDIYSDLAEGRLLLGGYVRHGSWNPGDSGDVFVATRFATVLDDYTMQFANIACVTLPCPTWTGVDSAGDVHFFDDLDIEGLGLSDREATDLFEKLHGSSATLRGYASKVEVELFSGPTTTYTFHVTQLVPEPAAE